MKRRSQRAFTLVELIIVIAVIGVLAAILIPVFANVIKKANAKSALSDARNAVSIYVTEATDKMTRGEYVPEHITLIVYKASRYYLFGYDFNVSQSIQVSKVNEDGGINAADLPALISDYSWNGLHAGTPYDPTVDQATLESYTVENDGAFYLVPYNDSGESQNPNVRGFIQSGTDYYYRIDDASAFNLTIGDTTAIYHGCLVGASFTTESSTGNTGNPGGGGTTSSDSGTPVVTDPTTYTVTLELNGVEVPGYQTSYTVNEGDIFSCNNPSATGKTFNGWKNGTESVTLPITITGDVTLTAQWSDETHTITIDPTWSGNNVTITGMPAGFNGGYTWDAPEGTNLNDIIGDLHASDITGKDFLGWTINGTNYDSSVTNALTADVTIAPVYGTTSLTVTFKVGTNETTINVDYGEHIDSADWPTNPSDDPTDGHFRHWSYGGGTYTDSYPNAVTENMTFTAVFGWYTVTFYETDGTSSISTTHTGDTYDVPAPTLTSNMYYHSSWSVSPDTAVACAVDATEYTANRDNITITAVETSKSVDVTFSSPAGASNVPASGTRSFATDGNTINLGTPTLEHHNTPVYTVTATDNASGTISGTTLTLSTSSTGSITVTLTFTADPTYSVTYDANGGTGTVPTDSTAYYSGETVTVLANNDLTNGSSTFSCWNTQADGNGTDYAADDTFSITGNVTLYAKWTAAITVWDGTWDKSSEPDLVDGYYLIYTPMQLVWCAANSHTNNSSAWSSGKKFKLMNDIYLNLNVLDDAGTALKNDASTYHEWKGFSSSQYAGSKFCGKFYGQGHTIHGVFMTNCYYWTTASNSLQTGGNHLGFFPTLSTGAEIHDLKFADCYILNTSKSCVGGVAGYTDVAVTIDNVEFQGFVKSGTMATGKGGVGGILGKDEHTSGTTSITNCTSRGYIATTAVGGTIANCGGVGGILGYDGGYSSLGGPITVSNCKNYATVTHTGSGFGGEYAGIGGIVGKSMSSNSLVEKCANYGTIGNSILGPSSQTQANYHINTGGIFGLAYNYNGNSYTIRKCKNEGMVTGSCAGLGGIAGGSGSMGSTLAISDCYNIGTIHYINNGTNQTVKRGGILGDGGSNTTVTNCYNAGSFTFKSTTMSHQKGYLINCGGTRTNCFYLDTLPSCFGNATSTSYVYDLNTAGATAKTQAEMQSLATTLGEAFWQGAERPMLVDVDPQS